MKISHQRLIKCDDEPILLPFPNVANNEQWVDIEMTTKWDPGPDSHPTTNRAEYSGLFLQADDPVSWVFLQ